MKLNSLKLVSTLAALFAVAAVADTVTGISCAQRWPWNGKVDISYSLTPYTEKTTPVFSVRFYGKIGDGETFALTTLEGDGASGLILGSGAKRTTWDASADLGSSINADNVKIAVVAQDVTSQATYLWLDLDTFAMNYSASGPTVGTDEDGRACKTSQIWFRRIEDGKFTMGSSSEPERNAEREGSHQVTITKAFYIAVFETTGAQFDTIVTGVRTSVVTPKDTISFNAIRGDVYGATWPSKTDYRVDSESFLGKLRAKTGNGLIFDLPTEAQWEMASRDKGNGTYWGDGYLNNGTRFTTSAALASGLESIAWFTSNAGGATHEVGTKNPSTVGLYDMHGNVWEWCLDWSTADITGYTTDPVGPTTGSARIARSGGWGNTAGYCRIAYRHYGDPSAAAGNRGFRLAIVQ